MIAASLGEVVSCAVRVPYEIVKMRSQTNTGPPQGNLAIFKDILAKEGPVGAYRGFVSTVIRDIPFSAIQYPIWERLKLLHQMKHKKPVNAIESAWYGAIAGAIAAFATTPLDVAKSRIMLADRMDKMASNNTAMAVRAIYTEAGVRGLFAGVVPRVIWISAGAFIFLGSYEKTIKMLD